MAGAGGVAACRLRPRRSPDTLVCAVRADITGFYPNPPFVNEAFTTQINWNVFEGLVGLDRELRLRPALAAQWSNPDERTSLFELRPGLRFSDGRPLRPEDVATSLLGARTTAYQDYFHAVTDVRPVGESRIELKTRFPYLVILTRLPFGLVLPAAEWDRHPAATIGTGPYRLSAWDRGERIALESNPFHIGQERAFRRVVFRVMPDGRERADAVRRGDVDVAEHVPIEALAELERDRGIRVLAGEGLRVMYLALRPNRPPFDDARVRQAVDLALDRDALLRRALSGRGSVATQLVPPAVVGFDPSLPKPRHDTAEARALLAAAGHGDGLELELHGTNNRYVNDVAVLDELARQLAEVGIRVRIKAMDKGALFALATAGGTRMHLIGWSCETADAGDVLDSVAHSKDATGLGAANDMDLADAELDRLIDDANASTSIPERSRRLQRAMARFEAARVYLPLYVQPESVAVSARLSWDPPPNYAVMPCDFRLASER